MNKHLTVFFLFILTGCAGGITGVALNPAYRVCDSTGAVCGISDKSIYGIEVAGNGKCEEIGVDFGDGSQDSAPGNFHLIAPDGIPFSHQYSPSNPAGSPRAWPGPRTVHAFSKLNCVGEARMPLNVLLERTDSNGQTSFSPAVRIGLASTTNVCEVPNNVVYKPIRMGSTVSITEVPGGPMINFCRDPSCTNNTAGNSGTVHSGFPFSNMRRHSLVLRIVDAAGGVQTVQGMPTTSFVADRTGPLEFCVNDTVLNDNSGAWAFDVTVDETTAP